MLIQFTVRPETNGCGINLHPFRLKRGVDCKLYTFFNWHNKTMSSEPLQKDKQYKLNQFRENVLKVCLQSDFQTFDFFCLLTENDSWKAYEI